MDVLFTACAIAVLLAVVSIPVGAWALAPDRPSSLEAIAADSPDIANLSWELPSAGTASSYRVYVALAPDGPYGLAGVTSQRTFVYRSGLPGFPYYFRVTAVNDAHEESEFAQAGPVSATWAESPHITLSGSTQVCADCHSVHEGESAPLVRAELATQAPFATASCVACHDGRLKAAANVASGSVDSFSLSSGHTLGVSADLTQDCSSCHRIHGSSSESPMLPGRSVNSTRLPDSGGAWCEACHDAENSWYAGSYPPPGSPSRDESGYPVTGTWPGPLVYSGTANAHRAIPESTQTADAGKNVRRAEGDCLYCHAAHRSANRYDSLLATFGPPAAGSSGSSGSATEYAALCFTCHGGVVPSGFSTAPVDIKRFVTATDTAAGHRVVTAGGTLPVGAPLPCYDCHGPHGSARNNRSLISDERGRNLETSSAAGVRRFCFTCHSTSDSARGWDSVSGAYVSVGAEKIEGIPRSGGVLKLPELANHEASDTLSCYVCHGSGYGQGGRNVHDPNPWGGYETATHTATPTAQPYLISGTTFPAAPCTTCHSAELGVEHAKSTSSGHEKSCSECHPAPQSALEPSWDKTTCVQGGCHTTSSAAPMHADIDSAHGTEPVNSECTTCHPDSLAAIHVSASAEVSGTVRTSCALCHADGVPVASDCRVCHGILPHDTSAAFCYTCHADPLRSYTGEAVFQTSAHSTTTTSAVAAVTYPGTTNDPGSCANCHVGHVATRASGDSLCVACHDAAGTSRPASYSYQSRAVFASSAHSASGCAACHPVHGSSAPGVQPGLVPDSADTCLTCHSSAANSTSGLDIAEKFSNATATTHHSVSATDFASSGSKMQCASCHNPHANEPTRPWSDPNAKNVAQRSALSDYVNASGSSFVLMGAQHDGVPPVVSGVAIDSSVDIYNPRLTWTTDKQADTYVEWGSTTAYGLNSSSATLSTAHSATFGPLVSGTTYHYRVAGTDAVGNTGYGPDLLYTPGEQPVAPSAPIVVNPVETATYSKNQLETFSWGAGSSGSNPVEYQVEVRDPSNSIVATSPWVPTLTWARSFAVPDLGANYWYSWRVKTRDATTLMESPWAAGPAFRLQLMIYGRSCPTLYTWNGSEYVFQTDVMGRGMLSLPLGAGYRYPVATEDTALDGSSITADGGAYRISLKNDQDEIDYVDETKLMVVDHPAGTKVVLDDLNPYQLAPTDATETIHTVRQIKPVVSASYDCLQVFRGAPVSNLDITAAVSSADASFAPASFWDDNRYTFDLGELGEPDAVKLVITGWTEYPTQAERAAVKAAAARTAQRAIEVQDSEGRWVSAGTLSVLPGFKKTVVFDLTGKFPAGVTRYKVRLRGWFRTHIDSVGFDTSRDEPVSVTEVSPSAAELSYSGVAGSTMRTGYPTYDYSDIVPVAITHDGDFTRYGDVMPLVSAGDDKFVVMDTGDEVKLSFPAPSAAADGTVRDFVLHAEGYHQNITGEADPLPFRAMSTYPYPAGEHYPDDADHAAYQSDWNTRHNSASTTIDPASELISLFADPGIAALVAQYSAQDMAVGSAEQSAPEAIHYSLNSDRLQLGITEYDGSRTAFAPAAGWESAATAASAVTPAFPGAAVADADLSALATAGGGYWVTDIATADRSWNFQLARFDLGANAALSARSLAVDWAGHGEPTSGYPVELYLWNFRTSAWDRFFGGAAPSDVTAATRAESIGANFCLGCHGPTTPSGVTKRSAAIDFSATWGSSGDFHGGGSGTGYGGGLDGYYRGAAALACATCHDTHGSNNLYHLNSTVNGKSGISVRTGSDMKNLCLACHTGSVAQWHARCNACHYGDPTGDHGDWSSNTPTESSDCLSCHKHGMTWDHSPQYTCAVPCHHTAGGAYRLPRFARTF